MAAAKTKKQNKKKRSIVTTAKQTAKKLAGPPVLRAKRLMARRPHRSFRLTRRRDYKRSLKLPGYWSLTNHVRATLWKNKKLFGGLVAVYVAVTVIISGYGAQQTYSDLTQLLRESSGDLFEGNLGTIGKAGLLLTSTIQDSLAPTTSEQQAQTVLTGFAVFFGWLTTIWLLRNVLAGHKPRLRDGLYNSGSPVLATILVGFIVTLQLIPLAVAVIIVSAALVSQLFAMPVAGLLVAVGALLLVLLSIYWISSSFIALVVVTLPGMYPMQAVRTAGDLVVGRRLRMLYRLLWLVLVVVVTWILIVIPIIIFDEWLKQLVPAIEWLPIVPLSIVTMAAVTLVFVSSYIYLLYRRIVDDDAAPA